MPERALDTQTPVGTSGGTSLPSGQASTPSASSAPGDSPFFEYEWEDGKKDSFKSPEDLKRYIREGTLRHSDYTRKRQADAEAAKKLAAREKELETLGMTLQQKKAEHDKIDAFLKQRRDVAERIAREMRTPAPGAIMDQTSSAMEEKLKPIQEKIQQWEERMKQEELERKRNQLFDHMKKQYPDFDSESVMSEITKLNEVPEEDNMRSLVEILYYAMKGRNTPAQIEKKITDELSRKQTLRAPVSSGAKVPDKSEPPNSIRDAANRAKRKLGV